VKIRSLNKMWKYFSAKMFLSHMLESHNNFDLAYKMFKKRHNLAHLSSLCKNIVNLNFSSQVWRIKDIGKLKGYLSVTCFDLA